MSENLPKQWHSTVTADFPTSINIGTVDQVAAVSTVGTVAGVTEVHTVDSVTNVATVASVTGVETVASVTNVAEVSDVAEVHTVDSVTSVGSVSTVNDVAEVHTVDAVTNVGTVAAVTNVGTVAAVTDVTNVGTVASVTGVTNVGTVANVTEVHAVDSVTEVHTVDTVTNVGAVSSVANVGTVANLTNVGTVANLTNVGTVASVTGVGTVNTVADVAKVDKVDNVRFGIEMVDSFGRLRSSEPFTLFEGKFLFDKQDAVWDEVIAGGGASVFSANSSQVALTVTNTNDRVVRQTYQYFTYQPGKSALVYMTGVLSTGGATVGVRSRLGQFDDANDKTFAGSDVGGDGVFFQLDGTVLSVVKRSFVSGSQVDTVVPQSSWNMDKMDGTGPSGVNIDVSKIQIFVIDYEWLSAGHIRFGFIIDDRILYCHTILNANLIATPWSRTATLPVRYEITRTSGTGAATMKQVCSTIISEGGFNPFGALRSASRGVATLAATTTLAPIISLRIRPDRRGAIKALSASILATTADNLHFEVRLGRAHNNPVTLTGASFANATESVVQVDTSATAASGGIILESGYISSVTRSIIGLADQLDLRASKSITGEPDILTLLVGTLTATATVIGAISWQELF